MTFLAAGILSAWVAIAAVAGSTGDMTPFGIFSFLAGSSL
jgi:hypothetical protein